MSTDDDVLTVAQASKILRIWRNALYNATARNEVPNRRIGKQIHLSRSALILWLRSWSTQVAKEKQ